MKNKFLLILGVIVVVVLFFWFVPSIKNKQLSSGDLQELKIPEYFIVDKAKPTAFTPRTTDGYYLTEKETLSAGTRYETDKSYSEALSELYEEMVSKGWTATAGTKQEGNTTIIKMVKVQDTIFLIVSGGNIEGEKTTVSIVPVKK